MRPVGGGHTAPFLHSKRTLVPWLCRVKCLVKGLTSTAAGALTDHCMGNGLQDFAPPLQDFALELVWARTPLIYCRTAWINLAPIARFQAIFQLRILCWFYCHYAALTSAASISVHVYNICMWSEEFKLGCICCYDSSVWTEEKNPHQTSRSLHYITLGSILEASRAVWHNKDTNISDPWIAVFYTEWWYLYLRAHQHSGHLLCLSLHNYTSWSCFLSPPDHLFHAANLRSVPASASPSSPSSPPSESILVLISHSPRLLPSLFLPSFFFPVRNI